MPRQLLVDASLIKTLTADETLLQVTRPIPIGGTDGQVLGLDQGGLTWRSVSAAASTLFVAANDASQAEKDAASYICDGVNDEVQIQAAINTGRPVLLSNGTFSLGAAIIYSNPGTFEGSGWKTVLKVDYSGYGIVFSGPEIQGAIFSNFAIDGNGAGKTAGGGINAQGSVQCLFNYIRFRNCYEAGLILAGNNVGGFGHHNKVLSCLFDATITVDGLGHGLIITSSDENLITSEFQYLGGLGGGAAGTVKTSAIKDTSGLNTIQNSVFVGGRNNARGVWVQDTQRTKILGCTFDGVSGDNVFVTGSKHIIANNLFTFIGDQGNTPASGVVLEFAVSDVNVLNNYFESSAVAAKTQSFVREPADGGGGNNQIVYNGYTVVGALNGPMFDLNKVGTIRFGNKGDAVGSKGYVESLGIPADTLVTLTADVANANATANTLQDVTGLSFNVVAGTRYHFKFVIIYTAAATTTGSRWTLNGPAFTTLHYVSDYSLTATTRTMNEGLSAYGLPAAANATSASTGSNMAIIEGVIQPSAAGTVIARFASEVANSAITAKIGSHVRVTRLG